MIVLAAPFTDWIVIAMLSVRIGAYVPSATMIVMPSTDWSIACWIVLNGCAALTPSFASLPFVASTYHVSVHLAESATTAPSFVAILSTCCRFV